MEDENGIPINPELFKVISPRIYVLDDGNMVSPSHVQQGTRLLAVYRL